MSKIGKLEKVRVVKEFLYENEELGHLGRVVLDGKMHFLVNAPQKSTGKEVLGRVLSSRGKGLNETLLLYCVGYDLQHAGLTNDRYVLTGVSDYPPELRWPDLSQVFYVAGQRKYAGVEVDMSWRRYVLQIIETAGARLVWADSEKRAKFLEDKLVDVRSEIIPVRMEELCTYL